MSVSLASMDEDERVWSMYLQACYFLIIVRSHFRVDVREAGELVVLMFWATLLSV